MRAFAQCFQWACCCRLREGQEPDDEVSELIVDLIFWAFVAAFSSSRTRLFTLISRDSPGADFLSRIYTFFFWPVACATPEYIHLLFRVLQKMEWNHTELL